MTTLGLKLLSKSLHGSDQKSCISLVKHIGGWGIAVLAALHPGRVGHKCVAGKAFPFSLPYATQFLILIPDAGPRNSRSPGTQFLIARHAIPGSFLTGPGATQFLIEIPIFFLSHLCKKQTLSRSQARPRLLYCSWRDNSM